MPDNLELTDGVEHLIEEFNADPYQQGALQEAEHRRLVDRNQDILMQPVYGQQQVARPEAVDPFEAYRVAVRQQGNQQMFRNAPLARALEDGAPVKKRKVNDEITFSSLIRDLFYIPAPPRPQLQDMDEVCRVLKLLTQKPYHFEDGKSLVGIEVEVENVLSVGPNIQLLFWQMVEDGSLRNRGHEFRNRGPIPLNYVEPALELLWRELNPSIDFSGRTSIHVHMDVRGFELNQLLTLLCVYAVVETLLFKFASLTRRSNIFCVPITETSLLTNIPFDSPKRIVGSILDTWQKYAALNLLSLQRFGTVEFRHMPGTKDTHKLLIWLDMLNHMKVFAYKTTLETALEDIGRLNTTSQYKEFLERVFGSLTAYFDMSNLARDMEKGVYIVKNLAVANPFHMSLSAMKVSEHSLLAKIVGFGSLVDRIGSEKYQLVRQFRSETKLPGTLAQIYDSLMRNPYHYLSTHSEKSELILKIIGATA